MKNPSEELVIAWLQECKGYFTMNNIKVPKKKGGMGAEIDILATNKEKNIWVEVSVATNPRRRHKKEVQFRGTIKDFLKDFRRADKNKKAKEVFFNKLYEKWLVYGKLPLKKEEVKLFPQEMRKNGVKTKYFGDILEDLFELKGHRLDAARGYINIIKAFLNNKCIENN